MKLLGSMGFFEAFGRRRQGNVAVLFGLAVPAIAVVVGGSIDLNRATSAQQALQNSLDAAALAVARSDAVTADDFEATGSATLAANLTLMSGSELKSYRFEPADNGRKVVAVAAVEVEATVLGVFDRETITVEAKSDIVRASRDIEVALVLDTTGSMAGQKIIDLRAAAVELTKVVVQTQQAPFYSKVAVVPYSMAVNLGDYANKARGAITPGVAITGASRTNPVVIAAESHGFVTGDRVVIRNVEGMDELNGRVFTVDRKNDDEFKLRGVDGEDYDPYASGGSAFCTKAGCQYFRFQNAASSSSMKTYQVSTCVTERTGSQAYTDAPPSVAPLGRNYPSPGNPCLGNTAMPLSSDRKALEDNINALQASGSTGGHVGVGWGWYMVSPRFGDLWPVASRPAAYKSKDLVKAVVIMTDGEYNSAYCNGVISRDSTSGSGAVADHINCDAPNGHAFGQARALCTAMKAEGVIVYTVGFDIVDDQRARDLVNDCATDDQHVYLPSTGAGLKDAFRAIAQDLSKLRIAN